MVAQTALEAADAAALIEVEFEPLPAVSNAVVNALSAGGIRHIAPPARPERIWRALEAAKVAAVKKAGG